MGRCFIERLSFPQFQTQSSKIFRVTNPEACVSINFERETTLQVKNAKAGQPEMFGTYSQHLLLNEDKNEIIDA